MSQVSLSNHSLSRYSFRQSPAAVEMTFKNADLHGQDLSEDDFRGVSFKGANLKNVNFSYSYLSLCDFRGADLRGADLTYADLTGADLTGADLRGAKIGADFRRACLKGADLRGARPSRTPMQVDGVIMNAATAGGAVGAAIAALVPAVAARKPANRQTRRAAKPAARPARKPAAVAKRRNHTSPTTGNKVTKAGAEQQGRKLAWTKGKALVSLPSKSGGPDHEIRLYRGAAVCNCKGGFFHGKCWALKLVAQASGKAA